MRHFFHTCQPVSVAAHLVKPSHLAESGFHAILGDSHSDQKSHGVLPNIAHNHWFVRPGISPVLLFHYSQPKESDNTFLFQAK